METAPFLLLELCLWIASILTAIHFLRLGRISKKENIQPPLSQPVSIIITTHEQCDLLRKNLPLILAQDFSAGYEVIVVDMLSTDDTQNYLERMEEDYPYLHHTSIPSTARDISMHRLALTLGVRSACYEWLVFTNADCQPSGSGWLSALTSHCTETVDAVLGFTRYADVKGWNACRCQFFRLWQQMLWLPCARHHAPYRADGSCLCYRKSIFLNHHGFASHANLIAGAETLMVNQNIRKKRCSINVHPEAITIQEIPQKRFWSQERLFFMETREHMRHFFLYRIWYAMNACTPVLYTLCTLALCIYFIPNPYVLIPLVLFWIIQHVCSIVCFNYTARQMGVSPFIFSFPWMLHRIPCWDIQAWLAHRFTKKQTFRKKFV